MYPFPFLGSDSSFNLKSFLAGKEIKLKFHFKIIFMFTSWSITLGAIIIFLNVIEELT
jgi:hypothetical protein